MVAAEGERRIAANRLRYTVGNRVRACFGHTARRAVLAVVCLITSFVPPAAFLIIPVPPFTELPEHHADMVSNVGLIVCFAREKGNHLGLEAGDLVIQIIEGFHLFWRRTASGERISDTADFILDALKTFPDVYVLVYDVVIMVNSLLQTLGCTV